jgi:hypothetical protein
MTVDELRAWLERDSYADIVDREIVSARPWLFKSDVEYQDWREEIETETGFSVDGIRIVGSAATGFSLSPLKPGRPFRRAGGKLDSSKSDIDITLIDSALFDEAWGDIFRSDRLRTLGGTDETRGKIRNGIYWGFISDKSIRLETGLARRLLLFRSAAGRTSPTRGHIIRYRLYRRLEDMREYHIQSLRTLHRELRI